MSLKKILDEWAKKLSAKASEKDTPLQESTDAFKAVTAYFTALGKKRQDHPDAEDETGEFSFADEVVNGSPGQHTKVRARRDS